MSARAKTAEEFDWGRRWNGNDPDDFLHQQQPSLTCACVILFTFKYPTDELGIRAFLCVCVFVFK